MKAVSEKDLVEEKTIVFHQIMGQVQEVKNMPEEVIYLPSRILCTEENKEACIATVRYMVALAEIVRKEGFKNLDKHVETNESFLLKDAVKMMQDGFDHKIFRHIMQNYIYFSNKPENEILIDYIIAQGIVSIECGNHPFVIKKILSSILGTEIAAII